MKGNGIWNFLIGACVLTACGTTSAPATNGATDAAIATDTAPANARGTRYCEILLGKIANGQVHIDVYNTEGLNDCPDAAWTKLDTGALKTDTGADVVVLNGPRYWTLDALEGSTLLDTTVLTLGGIDMRRAGGIDMAVADLATASQPYQQHTIHRQSAFHFATDKPLFELLDATGNVYAMQSYSAQTHKEQTLDSLAGLTTQLTLPTGWSFRTRVPAAELVLLATEATAIVTQDDFNNTYSLEK